MDIRLAVAAATIAAALAAQPASADDAGARAAIERLSARAEAELTDPALARPERAQRLRLLIHDHFDVDWIGRWVLGRFAPRATPAQRTEIVGLLEDRFVHGLVDRFATYAGERLAIVGTLPEGAAQAAVFSRVERPEGGPPLRVDWRLHRPDERWLIVDVAVEGVSLGQTQRAELGSILLRNGGDMEALAASLRAPVGP